MRCGISVQEFWELTPHETFLAIEAWIWREEQHQRQQVVLAWRIAALTRAKKLPSLKKLLSDRPARPLAGKELEQRRREFAQAGAGIDPSTIAARLKKKVSDQ